VYTLNEFKRIKMNVININTAKKYSQVLWLLMTSMTLLACGSQPAQVVYSVPIGIQSQQCFITQVESYIWLEQKDEWLELPVQSRQQFEAVKVNWLEENVLIVSLGQKPSAGYGIELNNWLLEQDHWQVMRTSQKPIAGRMQAQMITSPCIMVKIPKSIKSFTLNNPQGQALGRWPY
jgi:hypothetical protein